MVKLIKTWVITFLLMVLFAIGGQAATVTYSTVALDNLGVVNIIGTIDSGAGNEVTIIVRDTSANNAIVYIDQITSGTNGGFSFAFLIPNFATGKTYTVYLGGTSVYTVTTATIEQTLYRFTSVANNSLRIGNDIYDMQSLNLVASRVGNSIKIGGNKIYYKLGDKWYDIMNANATSQAYITNPANALSDNTVNGWTGINKIYYTGDFVFNVLK